MFSNRAAALLIALCQMTSAIFTEICSIAVISTQNDSMSVVMNYIALGIIAEIDNLYADSMEMVTFMSIKETENW